VALDGPEGRAKVLVEIRASGDVHTAEFTRAAPIGGFYGDFRQRGRPGMSWTWGRVTSGQEGAIARDSALHARVTAVNVRACRARPTCAPAHPSTQGKGRMPEAPAVLDGQADGHHYMGVDFFQFTGAAGDCARQHIREEAAFEKVCYIGAE